MKYDREIWDKLSVESMDFISKLLVKNPAERLKPAEALKHDWIKQRVDCDNDISSDVIANLVK